MNPMTDMVYDNIADGRELSGNANAGIARLAVDSLSRKARRAECAYDG